MPIPPTERQILLFLSNAGIFESRLKEQDPTDKEFLQRGMRGIKANTNTTEKEFIETLYRLKDQGLVTCSSQVHEHDSSEYIIKWKVSPKGISLLAGTQTGEAP